ncbi:MAG: MBL fold metallo-hydrolase [Candidatus Hydrogenedentota bacterium]|nr:MBL fold metallo-hydrolase [Candidatus Sumerlaea chitinivorans]RMH29755.1 MAG: MBL fold metallo-hydrolase [Candidatus Hydrogenedentota bacterium]GIX45595.1 MAG: MBL fold metallo-hydrolase [Candidatus Sumerlaea sp.]
MRVTLYGAARTVTGSAYHVETQTGSVLVDFGMVQGHDKENHANAIPPTLDLDNLGAVLLTHAHLDHCGRLPLLIKAGWQGPIYATPATREMASLILHDAAKVQAQDLERENRRRMRAGEEPVGPLYTQDDVDATMALFRTVEYDTPVPILPGITAKWVEAGHILGSTSIELTLEENGRRHVAIFSGDIGHLGAPVLRDPVRFCAADSVFMESTYGDRDHKSLAETLNETEDIIREAVARKAKILVPSFAVGRTQQLIYHLAALFRDGRLPQFPIYLDSPMAQEATRIYLRHTELYDEEAMELHRTGQLERDFSAVRFCATADESRALNGMEGPMLIMAGSGMCTAGRILHHLRNNLWKPNTYVLIVGFQAQGTLGRLLVEGRPKVKIFGEEIAVKASIHTLNGFSAHAGQSELLAWLGCVAHTKPQVYLTHGEPHAQEAIAAAIAREYGLTPQMPEYGVPVAL